MRSHCLLLCFPPSLALLPVLKGLCYLGGLVNGPRGMLLSLILSYEPLGAGAASRGAVAVLTQQRAQRHSVLQLTNPREGDVG